MLRRAFSAVFLCLVVSPALAQSGELGSVLAQIGGSWDWVETRLLAVRGESVLTPESEGYDERVVFEVLDANGGEGRILRDGVLLATDSFDLLNNAQPSTGDWIWMNWGSLGSWWVQLEGDMLILHADSTSGPRITYARSSVGSAPRSFGALKSDYSQP